MFNRKFKYQYLATIFGNKNIINSNLLPNNFVMDFNL